MRSQVQFYLRIRLADGSYPYLRAASAKKGRLKPGFGIHHGRAVKFPGSIYHLRYREADKRKWESVGSDESIALAELARKAAEIGDVDAGNAGVDHSPEAGRRGDRQRAPSGSVDSHDRETAADRVRRCLCSGSGQSQIREDHSVDESEQGRVVYEVGAFDGLDLSMALSESGGGLAHSEQAFQFPPAPGLCVGATGALAQEVQGAAGPLNGPSM